MAKVLRVQVKVSIPRAGEFLVMVPITLTGWAAVSDRELRSIIEDDVLSWVVTHIQARLLDPRAVVSSLKKKLGRR